MNADSTEQRFRRVLKGIEDTMTDSTTNHCLNCDNTEAETPMVLFRYQGYELWICAACLPIMIHERPRLMEKWAASLKTAAKEG